MTDDKKPNKGDEFIKALKKRITKDDIGEECKDVREGKNSAFGLMVNVIYHLGVFKHPTNQRVSELLYESTFDNDKSVGSGYLRLMDQRCGRKSFIPEEEDFWYEAGKRAFGENIVSKYSKSDFVRTPIWEIFKRARKNDLALPWEKLDPVLVLQLLALMHADEHPPATLKISKIENARPTPISGQGPTKFVYEEDRDSYQIGQMVNLEVEHLKPTEDFVVVEYAFQPYKRDRLDNAKYQAQHMRHIRRNGADRHAYLADTDGNVKLQLGDYGQLEGDHGFCLVTFPRLETSEEQDPFDLIEIEDLMTVDEFQDFALKLRNIMFHEPDFTVNLTEYNLKH